MARIRNRRAARTSNSGASWISYSDMMAALLLVFVLILSVSLYQYFTRRKPLNWTRRRRSSASSR